MVGGGDPGIPQCPLLGADRQWLKGIWTNGFPGWALLSGFKRLLFWHVQVLWGLGCWWLSPLARLQKQAAARALPPFQIMHWSYWTLNPLLAHSWWCPYFCCFLHAPGWAAWCNSGLGEAIPPQCPFWSKWCERRHPHSRLLLHHASSFFSSCDLENIYKQTQSHS